MAQIDGGDDWTPTVSDTGREWVINYCCPFCQRLQALHIQPGGWTVPVVPDNENHTGQSFVRNETTAEVQRWEKRRAAGEIKHEVQSEFVTELWCHACQKGVEVTLTE